MYKKLLPFLFFILFFYLANAQNEFITVWKPSLPSAATSNGIPFISNEHQIWFPGKGNNYTIYWEEVGYPAHHASLNVSSDYQILIDFGSALNPVPSEATYRVKVSNGNGNFSQIRFTDPDLDLGGYPAGVVGDNFKIINVEQWGNIQWASMRQAFNDCGNLDITATDIPDLSEVTDMHYMFFNCIKLVGNPTINNWDVSHVTSLMGTFNTCLLFNQPIGNWNTSNVTSMATTFLMAEKFNQPLANWDTSKVMTTGAMFFNAFEFNQPIGNWNMSNNLEMELMFSGAAKFNQPIGNWNTSKAIEMNSMFFFAKAFNQDISNWDTGNVTKMDNMFSGAEQFNSNISNWNVGKVTNMAFMFTQAKKFNQNIGGWDVRSVTNMNNMFSNASSFNQNLGNWELNSLLTANNLLLNTALTCQNYDSTLYGWSQNQSIPNNINISAASPLVYSSPQAVTARDYLLNYKGWTITGDTYDQECAAHLGTSETKTDHKIRVSPNPATDIIYIKNIQAQRYIILDFTGRIISKGAPVYERINIRTLAPGNYILQLQEKDSIQNIKFIKK